MPPFEPGAPGVPAGPMPPGICEVEDQASTPFENSATMPAIEKVLTVRPLMVWPGAGKIWSGPSGFSMWNTTASPAFSSEASGNVATWPVGGGDTRVKLGQSGVSAAVCSPWT
jgi:hypothetical protein